ncbi:MAG: hypothetical protein RRA92_08985 [Gemmatimonadota bacterium]|nr:hypothetical protein [Gemmatimonadota bacterium]
MREQMVRGSRWHGRVSRRRGGAAFRVAAVLLAVLAAGGGLATRAAAQEDASEQRVARVLGPQEAARVRELAGELAREGIPPRLVRRKVLEGAAKGVPADRIVAAVEDYAGRLREARSLVGPGRTGATFAAAAEARRRGVPPDAIRGLADRRSRQRNLAVPLLVLGDLVESGVPVDQAAGVVEEALRRGAGPGEMMGMSAAARRRIRMGEDPAAVMEGIRARVRDRPGAGAMGRDRSQGARRRTPGERPLEAAPVPPGSNPPRTGDMDGMRSGPI